MLTSCVVRLVDLSRRFALPVILLALVASVVMGGYVTTHFKINTDVNQLLADNLDWRNREVELEKAFPQKVDRLAVVIDGDDADSAENAAAALTARMQATPALFSNVTRPDSLPFFRKNGMLYLSEDELSGILDMLVKAQPLLGTLAADPSLRGLFGTLALVLEGLGRGDVTYDQLDHPFDKLATAVESVSAGEAKPFPWRSMMGDGAPKPRDLRKFIMTQPVLNYSAIAPGAQASAALRQMANELGLTPDHGLRVRLTGSVALNDEEFASVADGTGFATILSVVLVLVILFLALRSARLILPILFTLAVGLVATTAFAMATVGSLNLISVAFAVMFVGIAVDFGIQFGVRYRDQHHQEPDNARAMLATARIIALPLALAAGSTSLGFLTFIPTDYRGVAELGLIAGAGMIIAFLLNITLLPALLAVFHPPAEPEAVGFAWAAPIDRFILRQRRKILIAASVLAIVALGIATQIRFDFDPLNLKDPKTESVATMFDLMKDPQTGPYVVEMLEPSWDIANEKAKQLEALPEVDHVMTLASFVPEDQEKKLSLIGDANFLLAPTLNPTSVQPPPSEEETFESLQKAAEGLRTIQPPHPSAQRLAEALEALVQKRDPALLSALHKTLISGMETQLATVRESLTAEPVTLASITPDLRRDWIAPDGRVKIEVYPKGDARDYRVLTAFTDAVQKIAPEASGAPISIQESGNTVARAFMQAGFFALLAISFLAWLILRSVADVARLLAPLILAGILTLATMVILPLPLNFANIIALPLLLSLGVSYAIYFVSSSRAGVTFHLQSSVARAVLFSAATTLVAFGSLSLSAHPGTSGMGELLTIALLYSLLSTFVLLPALLGRRQ
ncbi:MAG: MMPL family transporter [Alphaproteobacteria bacterium]|nr:MMPL family transporter [Alphaproteobacteria bacterium]